MLAAWTDLFDFSDEATGDWKLCSFLAEDLEGVTWDEDLFKRFGVLQREYRLLISSLLIFIAFFSASLVA